MGYLLISLILLISTWYLMQAFLSHLKCLKGNWKPISRNRIKGFLDISRIILLPYITSRETNDRNCSHFSLITYVYLQMTFLLELFSLNRKCTVLHNLPICFWNRYLKHINHLAPYDIGLIFFFSSRKVIFPATHQIWFVDMELKTLPPPSNKHE